MFQYLGSLDMPGQIGWLSANGRFTYHFRSNRVGLWDVTVKPEDLIGEPLRAFTDLLHYWESIQLALARTHTPEDDPQHLTSSSVNPTVH